MCSITLPVLTQLSEKPQWVLKDFTTELGSPFSTSHMLLIHRGEMPQNYFQLSQRITVGSQHPLRSQTPVILVPGTQCPLTSKCPLIHVDTRFREIKIKSLKDRNCVFVITYLSDILWSSLRMKCRLPLTFIKSFHVLDKMFYIGNIFKILGKYKTS